MGRSKSVGGAAVAAVGLALALVACAGPSDAGADPNPGAAGAAPTSANVFVDQIRGREGCLPRPLQVVETAGGGLEPGQTRCSLTVVVAPAPGAACACDASQHLVLTAPAVDKEVRIKEEQTGSCGGASGVSCEGLCLCDLQQSTGAALTQCQTDAETPSTELPPGFCLIDATLTPPVGNPALVSTCPANSRRELRILGPLLEPDPVRYLACAGASLQ